MRWISALTRTIAVTTGCLPGSLCRFNRARLRCPFERGWRLRYYAGPGAELLHGADAAVRQPPDQPAQHVRGGARVGQRAVARRRPRAEEPGQRAQLAVGHLVRVHHLPGQHDRVQHGEAGPGQPAVAAPGDQEAEIERRVVRDQHAPLREPPPTSPSPFTRTAPISVIAAAPGDQPVVSRSTTTNSRSPSSTSASPPSPGPRPSSPRPSGPRPLNRCLSSSASANSPGPASSSRASGSRANDAPPHPFGARVMTPGLITLTKVKPPTDIFSAATPTSTPVPHAAPTPHLSDVPRRARHHRHEASFRDAAHRPVCPLRSAPRPGLRLSAPHRPARAPHDGDVTSPFAVATPM